MRCDGIGRPQRQLVAPADSISYPSTPSTPGPARRLQWFDPRGKGTAESRSDGIEPREYAEYPGYAEYLSMLRGSDECSCSFANDELSHLSPEVFAPSVRDTVPCGIPCRAGYRAVRDTSDQE
jgi:hypothetical protein